MKTCALTAILVLLSLISCMAMPGGLSDVQDTNSEQFQKILNLGRKRVNSMSNSIFESKVTEVLSAKQQVVSGIRYVIEFEVSDTTCTKGSNEAKMLETCQLRSNASPNICTVEIVEKAWLNSIKVVKAKCHKKV
ncbi:Cystatin-1 [Halotydeus destructor]|nr:Cystatin-1 [Halotydeus destructor]